VDITQRSQCPAPPSREVRLAKANVLLLASGLPFGSAAFVLECLARFIAAGVSDMRRRDGVHCRRAAAIPLARLSPVVGMHVLEARWSAASWFSRRVAREAHGVLEYYRQACPRAPSADCGNLKAGLSRQRERRKSASHGFKLRRELSPQHAGCL